MWTSIRHLLILLWYTSMQREEMHIRWMFVFVAGRISLTQIELTVMVYYHRRIQIKISQGTIWVRVQEVDSAIYVSLTGALDSINSSQQQYVTICNEYCQSEKLPRALVSGFIIGAYSHRPAKLTWTSGPSRGRADTGWPKAPAINHIIRLYCVAQGSQINKDLLMGRAFQRPADCHPGAESKD